MCVNIAAASERGRFHFAGKDGIHLFHAKVGDEKENEKPKGEGGMEGKGREAATFSSSSITFAFVTGCRRVAETGNLPTWR